MTDLKDSFGRRHHYLRISLTDRCDFRCTYCMPEEQMKFMNPKRLMNATEVFQLASLFTEMGVTKIRLTGGEPTIRRDFPEIVGQLSKLNVDLSITTNGATLHKHLDLFERNGLKSINVSLDSLQSEKFEQITRRDLLYRVLENIKKTKEADFKLKINVVVIKGFNDDEILDFIEWSGVNQVDVRFIEFMPFFGNQWDYEKVYKRSEMLSDIQKKYQIEEVKSPDDSTSVNFNIPELSSKFGIISTISNPFCNGCSRLRLTAEGRLKNCLFSTDETDLLTPLRQGDEFKSLIINNILRKKASAAGKIDFESEQAQLEYATNSPMIAIGG